VDIPASDEFFSAGSELLDYSWEIAANLLIDMEEAEFFDQDIDDASEEYWSAARRRLTIAATTTQQAIELCLKGKIAEISPYLLLADPPSRWPSHKKVGLGFSDFRMLDAQDLVPVLQMFSTNQLNEDFILRFHDLRNQRNRIVHSVADEPAITVKTVIENILFAHASLLPGSWAPTRHEFLRKSPAAAVIDNDWTRNRVCQEVSSVIGRLDPSVIEKYFGIDKRQRLYVCDNCMCDAILDAGFEYKTAVLRPNGPGSTSLYCAVCDSHCVVERRPCQNDSCPGNVFGSETGYCLTCGI